MNSNCNKKSAILNRLSNSKLRRLESMQNGFMCDCEFLVGISTGTSTILEPQQSVQTGSAAEGLRKFKAHKMLLATASEVFERMFYGAEFVEHDKARPIRIDDVTPEIFEILLRYIYLYEFEAGCLTVHRCRELFYVGYKYMMEDFIDACVAALGERPWMMSNVLPMYELACFYDNLPLMLLSYKEIHKHAVQLLNHHTFFDLDVYNLKRLVVLLTKVFDGKRLLQALESYNRRNNLGFQEDKTAYKELQNAAVHISFPSDMPRPQSNLLVD